MADDVVKIMETEVARFEESGESPLAVFVQSAKSFAKERAFLATVDASTPIRRRTKIGMNEKGEQSMWVQLFNDDTDELLYTANEIYSCPPWPEIFCDE